MNTDNLRVKWIEVEASVWEGQQTEVKALREDVKRLKSEAIERSKLATPRQFTEEQNAYLRGKVADLESQLAELRQGGEAVAYAHADEVILAKHWRGGPSGPDGWEPLYTRPQPAIPPGYVVVKSELFEAVAALVRFACDWNQGTHAKLYRPVICRLVGEHIAAAPAIQPQASTKTNEPVDATAGEGAGLPDAITFLRDNDLAATEDWMQGWNDLRSIVAEEIAKRDAEIARWKRAFEKESKLANKAETDLFAANFEIAGLRTELAHAGLQLTTLRAQLAGVEGLTDSAILTDAHRYCCKYVHTDDTPYRFTERGIIEFVKLRIAHHLSSKQEPQA